MSIFELPTQEVAQAKVMADGFLAEGNQVFQTELERAYDLVQRFWYRNRDAEGNPSATGEAEPTGPEILTQMGPFAQAGMAVAYARVQMLVGIATALGKPELVDLTKLAPPFDLTFNSDGSLLAATPKSTPEEAPAA